MSDKPISPWNWVTVILCLPFLPICLAFDIIKIPILLFFLGPIWGLLDLIEISKGKKSLFFEMMADASIMGITTWLYMAGFRDDL